MSSMSKENSNQPINNAAELQQRYAQGERDFSKANLAATDLRDMDLKGANLQGANLKGAYLRGANFKEANLQEAILKESDLRGANLSSANLKGAYLSGASLELSIMQGANLLQANLRGANLGGAMLIGACLEKAELTFADLSDVYMISQGGSGGANLEGANLQGAILSKANLRGANLSGANLKEANLKGAFPQGAYYDARTHFPAGFDPANSGMQKIQISNKKSSSSAKSSSSLLKSKHFFTFATVSGIGLVLVPAGIIYTWTQINKSNSTGIAKAKSEVEVSYEANQPAAESDIEASIDANGAGAEPDIEANLKTHKPGAKPKIKVSLKANQPAAKPENTVKEANKPNSAATSQAKTEAKSENTVKEANKPNSAATPNDKRNHAAAKPAGAISTVATQVASCPALVRTINAANPDDPSAVDISINGKQVFSNVPFSQASRYVSVSPGQLYIQIMKAGTKTLVDERRFAAAANTAYSVAVTGSLPGPPGQLLFNKSPFVIPEDLSPPSPGKFKGRWYKLSEMKAVIDLRIAKLDTPNISQARLVDVIPKTAVVYPELKAGTYNFNTALPNKSDPIINTAYNPPIRVEIAKAKIPAGTIFDIFAIGNDLGKKGRNSLKLSAASYKTLPPTATGCMRVQ